MRRSPSPLAVVGPLSQLLAEAERSLILIADSDPRAEELRDAVAVCLVTARFYAADLGADAAEGAADVGRAIH